MSIAIHWHDAGQTIINLTIKHGWTWAQLQSAIEQADSMIASVSHRVHLIIDIRQSGRLPRDFMSVANQLLATGEARANEGLRVVVGASALMRAAYRSLLTVYGAQLQHRPFLFAADLDEAHRLATMHPTHFSG